MSSADIEPFERALGELLAAECPLARVRAIELGESSTPLWSAIEASGFADAMLPETLGGAELGFAGVLALAEVCGWHALPVTLPETMLMRSLLHDAGTPIPREPLTCEALACGVHADALCGWRAALIAAQIAGALRRVLDMTVAHATTRRQFGRAISAFQAVQQQISVMAEHVAAARIAARMAGTEPGRLPDLMQCAVAKAGASAAVESVCAIAHAVHGAMGMTAECDLQLFTRRLQAWRVTAGSEHYWHRRIGSCMLAAGDASLPEFVIATLAPLAGGAHGHASL